MSGGTRRTVRTVSWLITADRPWSSASQGGDTGSNPVGAASRNPCSGGGFSLLPGLRRKSVEFRSSIWSSPILLVMGSVVEICAPDCAQGLHDTERRTSRRTSAACASAVRAPAHVRGRCQRSTSSPAQSPVMRGPRRASSSRWLAARRARIRAPAGVTLSLTTRPSSGSGARRTNPALRARSISSTVL